MGGLCAASAEPQTFPQLYIDVDPPKSEVVGQDHFLTVQLYVTGRNDSLAGAISSHQVGITQHIHRFIH